jgi:HIT domain
VACFSHKHKLVYLDILKMKSPPPSPTKQFVSPSVFPVRTKMASHGAAPAPPTQKTDDAGEDLQYDDHCPFCAIALSFSPVNPLNHPQEIAQKLDSDKTNPPSMVIYSGQHVIAFLDIQPLTWGHTLVIPRRHRVKMGDLGAADGAEVGDCCYCSALP